METKTRVDVRIADKDYILAGNEPQHYILNLATFVDRKISEMLKLNPMLSTSMAAVLTSVNVADDYFKTLETERNAVENYLKLSREMEILKEQLSLAKKEVEVLRRQNSMLDIELTKQEEDLKNTQGELKDYKLALERTSKIRFYSKGS